MIHLQEHKQRIVEDGFTIINNVFEPWEIAKIVSIISSADTNRSSFRKTKDLFAIRKFLIEVPDSKPAIFTETVNNIIDLLFGNDFFVVKSIYFDKPEESNWFVAYHQDLTISVDAKVELKNYGPWTVKQNQFAVQPPVDFLENNFTVRIHLDDTDENNGALKVIRKSHLKAIYRPETINWENETEEICRVKQGGIMIMRPLLLHSSGRSFNKSKRRVVHIEFSNRQLPEQIKWSEFANRHTAALNIET